MSELPDRLSIDPRSPYYNAEVLSRDVGIGRLIRACCPVRARSPRRT